MKHKIITTTLILLASLINTASFAQCDNCDKALAKDYIQSNSSIQQQLNVLKIMDKETFEEYKSSSSGGGGAEIGIPGILSFAIGGSANYDEFKQKREKLFQLYSYNYSEAQAKSELRIVTNAIAYPEWSKCITTCYNSQSDLARVYGYITYADSNTIFVKVKYKSAAASKNHIVCSITADNGTILQEFGRRRGYYYENLLFSLNKEEEIGFTIKRTSRHQNTIISISADGSNVYREVSAFSNTVSLNYTNVDIKYTLVHQKDTFSRWGDGKVTSPSLHELKSGNPWGDLYVQAFKSAGYNVFKRGDFLACNNVITLLDLPENQYYKSFTSVECLADNQGACGWSRSAGLNESQRISDDKRHASVVFTTGSRDCVWGWKGEVHEVSKITSTHSVPVKVDNNYFVVTIPKNATGSTLVVTINGNQFLIVPGKDDATNKIKFITQTEDGTNQYYSYFIK